MKKKPIPVIIESISELRFLDKLLIDWFMDPDESDPDYDVAFDLSVRVYKSLNDYLQLYVPE